MAHFYIMVVRPRGYLHSDCFREVVDGLANALQTLQHTVDIGENTIHPAAVNILLGAHLLNETDAMALPPATIIYNLEQLGGSWLPPWYMRLAAMYRIWDYSPLNIQVWNSRSRPLCRPALVPVGYAPNLTRIRPASPQDIDVLFYGLVNNRRRAILQEIEALGLNLKSVFGVYGSERDSLIARSKVVLNMHAHATEMFEIVRVSYLLANAKAVVSECSPDIGEIAGGMIVAERSAIAERCRWLVDHDAERKELESCALALFSTRSQAEILAGVLGSQPWLKAVNPLAAIW